jgi:hypothetical protein
MSVMVERALRGLEQDEAEARAHVGVAARAQAIVQVVDQRAERHAQQARQEQRRRRRH